MELLLLLKIIKKALIATSFSFPFCNFS